MQAQKLRFCCGFRHRLDIDGLAKMPLRASIFARGTIAAKAAREKQAGTGLERVGPLLFAAKDRQRTDKELKRKKARKTHRDARNGGEARYMEILLVGCGKVGTALVAQLSQEGHSITVIDSNADKVERIKEEFDVMGMAGNGCSATTLVEAGVERAEVFIAVTGSDELNLLCCMFAKRTGRCCTIARVRNPMYSREVDFMKQQLGISVIINPELMAAKEISRLLRFPAASKIDSFADDRVRLIKFPVTETQGLVGFKLRDLGSKLGHDVLVCAVERDGDVSIPSGEFQVQNGDLLTILVPSGRAGALFGKLHMPNHSVRSALVVGGGTIGYYLTRELVENKIRVRIVDSDYRRCEQLSVLLPEATILHGDGTDRRFLMEAGLPLAESFVSLTNIDEENILLALYAKRQGVPKIVSKINRLEFDDLLEGMDVDSVVYPKYLICDYIVQYIRALQNQAGNNVKTLYRILDNRVEALEFTVDEASELTGVSLLELNTKPNLLICCIIRGDQIIIPRGYDRIHVGDTVIVVTLERGMHDILDILAD